MRRCPAAQLCTSLSIILRSALALLGVAVAWREALDERLSRSIGAETVVLSDARIADFLPAHTRCVLSLIHI